MSSSRHPASQTSRIRRSSRSLPGRRRRRGVRLERSCGVIGPSLRPPVPQPDRQAQIFTNRLKTNNTPREHPHPNPPHFMVREKVPPLESSPHPNHNRSPPHECGGCEEKQSHCDCPSSGWGSSPQKHQPRPFTTQKVPYTFQPCPPLKKSTAPESYAATCPRRKRRSGGTCAAHCSKPTISAVRRLSAHTSPISSATG